MLTLWTGRPSFIEQGPLPRIQETKGLSWTIVGCVREPQADADQHFISNMEAARALDSSEKAPR